MNHLKLYQGKRASIGRITNSIGGTWNRYSNKAIPQLIKIIDNTPNLLNHFHSANFKWPYQAKVMKELERTSNATVRKAFIGMIGDKEIGTKVHLNYQT